VLVRVLRQRSSTPVAGPLLGAAPELAKDERVTPLMPPWETSEVQRVAGTPPTEAQLAAMDRETAVYRQLTAVGTRLAIGTDAPIIPTGLGVHLGLRVLRRSGLTGAETLRTATAMPSRIFGLDRDLGTLEVGKLADLAVIDGDPFTTSTRWCGQCRSCGADCRTSSRT
jgi:imidazolonepropionase-like amidohydrolase